MITIEINEETETIEDMAYCLEEIVRRIRSGGSRIGYDPSYAISGEEEPESN